MVLLLRILILGLIAWMFFRLIRSRRGTYTPRVTDPRRVLGVGPNASPEDIRRAYHKALKQYHPDRVADLGKDLQNLASQRTREIVQAYRQLAPQR